MRKKAIKNLSTMALAVIIGVSAFGPIAHAMECNARSANSVTCTWCGSLDVDFVDSHVVSCTSAGPEYHTVKMGYEYYCNPCSIGFDLYEYIDEAHNYGFDAATGQIICSDCGDVN